MASAAVDSKPQSEAGTDIAHQENVSPRNQPSRQSSKSQVRHRASVACASCRDRRIRCVVPKGERECTQCKRTGTECIIKNDDERRRPISKAYMSSLSERINMLESMLLDKGVVPPPAVHPPKTRQEAQSKQPEDTAKQPNGHVHSLNGAGIGHSPSSREIVPSPPDSGHDDFAMNESDQAESIMAQSHHNYQPLTKETSPFRNLDPRKEDIVFRLLATKGNLSFDQLSGRFRFFGPTANSHVYSDAPFAGDLREPPEQIRRSERIVRSLTPGTHEYLMSCFWEHYNLVMPVLDQAAFERDRESQCPRFYSSFLHITVLAMGYRFADQDREDMRKISLGNRESTLHREAKYMMDIELERPGGIPSVQALLLLGDLECGVGRDNTGWMYSGMANRLAFDIGLHLDCQSDTMPDQEIQIRHMVMKACIVFDKYWALFLGRPTSIKSQDIGIDLLSKRFSMLASGSETKRDAATASVEIYEYLIELMELAGKISETRDYSKANANDHNNIFAINESEESAYLHVISLDRQLQNWYRRLPDHLTWKPANIKAAPFNYFLLHQQYHVSMILLHRPWAKYGVSSSDGASTNSHPSPAESNHHGRDSVSQKHLTMVGHGLGLGDPQSIVDDSRTSLSRSICTQQAIRVARIFWQHRQRFDGRKMCSTGMQHAGSAAIALIAALAFAGTDADRRSYLGYLDILSAALTDMGHTYEPAARMDELLKAVLDQFRGDTSGAAAAFRPGGATVSVFGSAGSSMMSSGWQASPDTAYSVLPARREHPDQEHTHPAVKKIRPTPSRRASEFTRPPPPFFAGNRQPTPPSSAQSHHAQFGMSHHGSFSHMIPGLYPGAEPSEPFNLDFLGGSAIDLDEHDERNGDGGMRSADEFALVTPASTEAWGVGSGMNGTPANAHSGSGLDLPMGDWIASPANLATATNNNGVPKSGSGPTSVPEINGNTKSGSPGPDHGQVNHNGDTEAVARHQMGVVGGGAAKSETSPSAADMGLDNTNVNGGGGMEWMGSEGGLNALSPVGNLRGLVDKTAAGSVESGMVNGGGRNHELDFFSF